MKVEKVPDSTYEMVGGLDKQILEIKEVSFFFFLVDKEGGESARCHANILTRTTGNRTSNQAPRAVRSARYRAAQGSHSLWPAWYWKDAACSCSSTSYGLHFHPRFWLRVSAEIYWRRRAYGPRTVRDGSVSHSPHFIGCATVR